MKEEKTRILLVDDHTENLLALEALLADLNQNLVRAESGREALRLVLQQDFAVILLDVEMPVLNGFETAEFIRGREKSRNTPIIFLTAHNRTEEHIFKGYSLGAVDYLTKPFVPGILRSKVKVFVELHKQRQESQRQTDLLAEANRFISAILDNAGSIVLVLDDEGCIVQCNRAFERILGFTAAEAEGKRLSRFVEFAGEGEGSCIARDGSHKIIAWSQTRITGGENVPGLTIVTGNDITERKRLEKERERSIQMEAARVQAEIARYRVAFLAEAAAKLASTLEYEQALINISKLPVPEFADWSFVIAKRADGTGAFVVWHEDPEKQALASRLQSFQAETWPRLLGAKEVFQTGCSKLFSETSACETSEAPDCEILNQVGCRSAIVVPLKSRQTTLGLLAWISESPGRYGPSEVTLAENLAQQVSLTLENVQLYRGAQLASQAKDEFLATLSHEIRTPLTAILGWMSILQKKQVDEATMARAMESVFRNAMAQSELIEDMLDVSRIITGRISIECSALDFSVVIEAAIDSVRPAAEAKNVRLNCDIKAHDSQMWGDRDRLQQVLWNLLSNAVKFTPPGGTVSVKLQRGPANLELAVSDTGMGIPSDFLPFVFDRFRQAEGSKNRRYGGLGLGLSIARHLVELHGGTIEAFSEGEGKGATFTVSLPIRTLADVRIAR